MRLSTILITVAMLAACTGEIDPKTSSIQCTTGADGAQVCSQQNGGDEGDPTDPGENEGGAEGATCSGENCVEVCDGTADGDRHNCTIECDNGLRCESSCCSDGCTLTCTCPDDNDDPGDDEEKPCDLNPDSTECYCQDHPEMCGNDDGEQHACDVDPDSEACFCEKYPDACDTTNEEPPCTDTDNQECYCQMNPGSPECT